MAEIIEKTGKSYNIFDKVNNVWNKISFWHKASDCEFDDGKTAQTKVGAINGITSDLTGEAEDIAASIKCVNQLNSSLNSRYNPETDKMEILFNGIWTPWISVGLNGVYLVKNGIVNTDTELCGGGTSMAISQLSYKDSPQSAPSVTVENGLLVLSQTTTKGGEVKTGTYVFNNKIDLTDFSKLKWSGMTSYKEIYKDNVAVIIVGMPEKINGYSTPIWMNCKDLTNNEFDISSLVGSYYIGIECYSGNAQTVTFSTKNLWLER